MRAVAFAMFIASSVLLMPAANSQVASTFYHSRYLLAGFLLRAGAVCGGDSKRTIDAAFGLLNNPELRAVSKAYPDTRRQWMGEGAANFNNGVMNDGIGPTCAYAMTVRSQAEEIGKSGSLPPPGTSSPAARSLEGCTQERAEEIARSGTVNDPCLVHWRAIEARKHPERATLLECNGLKAYEDPQPPGHPAPLAECDRITRQSQQRMGLPATGFSEELKATYRATWGQ